MLKIILFSIFFGSSIGRSLYEGAPILFTFVWAFIMGMCGFGLGLIIEGGLSLIKSHDMLEIKKEEALSENQEKDKKSLEEILELVCKLTEENQRLKNDLEKQSRNS